MKKNKTKIIVVSLIVIIIILTAGLILEIRNVNDLKNDPNNIHVGDIDTQGISDDEYETEYAYLKNVEEHKIQGDLPKGEEFTLMNYTEAINDDMTLAMVGYESDTEVLYFDLELLDSNLGNGYGKQDYAYSNLSVVSEEEIMSTLTDVENIDNYIVANDAYPTEDDIELGGVITFDQYSSLFNQFDIGDRDIIDKVGKSL